ncbi:MAG: Gfo/Idh/MocA family oxidoreductase [Bacteroidales bacterium]|nr:Gfo/Idh/MocA family oxidoreductase [Bacteroidales bacterium]
MNSKVKWGILSTASIGTEHVIPAMIKGEYCDVQAIASRNKDAAEKVAKRFEIPRAYGSYEELLLDHEIDVVYIPLPNHLHVPWSIKAIRAGKHVLVEKPVGLSSEEARRLLDESLKHPELKVMEAFMYRHHPQWLKAKELVESGMIGKMRTIQSSFSFFEDNPESIVNKKEFGGGSIMDIGCYPISLSRFLFNAEPKKVYANIEVHPEFKTDTLATAVLEFEHGTSAFFSSTLMPDNQQVEIFGTEGSIKFELPFNPMADKPAKIWLCHGDQQEEIVFDSCDQYTIQGDLFSLAVLNDTPVPTPLQDALDNMIVIERLFNGD